MCPFPLFWLAGGNRLINIPDLNIIQGYVYRSLKIKSQEVNINLYPLIFQSFLKIVQGKPQFISSRLVFYSGGKYQNYLSITQTDYFSYRPMADSGLVGNFKQPYTFLWGNLKFCTFPAINLVWYLRLRKTVVLFYRPKEVGFNK